MDHPPDSKTSHHAISRLGVKAGGPARARALTPERRKEIARLGALARAAKHKRAPLKAVTGRDLVAILLSDTSRSFTKAELRKIVNDYGYKLDRRSRRYFHRRIDGWIVLPQGASGVLSAAAVRSHLQPLLEALDKLLL
jgi:hypothetical protein